MAFADSLAAFDTPPIKGPPCGVGVTLDTMPETDAQALQAALDNSTIGPSAIERALRAEGYRVSRLTITRHRRGECLCEVRRGIL